MKKALLIILFVCSSTFAAGEKLAEIKKDLLTSDPYYMDNHTEEALAEKIDSSPKKNTTIPKRVPDKFVSILIMPYVDSSDVYHDESKIIHKHKSGKWIFGEYTNIEEQSDVSVETSGEEFTYFDGDRK
jgi:hypothetical protein